MAEIPEIIKFCEQLDKELCGRRIQHLDLLQPKNLNAATDEYINRCTGAAVKQAYHKGKWIFLSLDNGENLLISLGMGCDILFHADGDNTDKYQIRISFFDGCSLTLRYWWFGRFLLVRDEELSGEPSTAQIALDPFDAGFTYDYFRTQLSEKRTRIKAFLLDQRNIGGIGNMYMHDILFLARLHPMKKIPDLTGADIKRLYQSILTVLNGARASGAFCYEKDIYGQYGAMKMSGFLVGYKEGAPCPGCGTPIELIKTGSTSSYICPRCQIL